MNKKTYFFIDDVIWCFRDIARQRPASIFDQHYLKMFKKLHDRFGFKVVLNSFYRTDYFYGDDEFSISEMPDAYKAEWEANSDWLKIGFHAKQEFPDYPNININYDDMKNLYTRFAAEVKRFAGEKVLSATFNPHWSPMSREGCQAMKDCGIKIICATAGERAEYNGDPSSLPYGHAARLLNNRKPETGVFIRESRDGAISRSLCGYNHMTKEDYAKTKFTCDFVHNEEMDIYHKKSFNCSLMNLTPLDEIEAEVEAAMGMEYVSLGTHEQYAYPEYYAYQPDTYEKFVKACEVLKRNGYEYVFVEDLLN